MDSSVASYSWSLLPGVGRGLGKEKAGPAPGLVGYWKFEEDILEQIVMDSLTVPSTSNSVLYSLHNSTDWRQDAK